MANKNPITPYARLHQKFVRFIGAVRYPKNILAFTLTDDVSKNAHVDVKARIQSADTLGFDTVVTVVNDRLHYRFVEKRPADPCI